MWMSCRVDCNLQMLASRVHCRRGGLFAVTTGRSGEFVFIVRVLLCIGVSSRRVALGDCQFVFFGRTASCLVHL
jgi:hypothetical protein